MALFYLFWGYLRVARNDTFVSVWDLLLLQLQVPQHPQLSDPAAAYGKYLVYGTYL